jgi:predicted DCC family thiol-disulfide oxidoreductase YuxK
VTAVAREVPWLIFDGDCGFCTSSTQWLAGKLHRRLGPNARLVPWQFTDLAALGTTAQRAQREVLWVATNGTIHGGAAAFADWLKFRGGAYAIPGHLMSLPLVRSLAAAVYRVIAKNRHRMPGGSPACALPPAGFDPAQPGTKAL